MILAVSAHRSQSRSLVKLLFESGSRIAHDRCELHEFYAELWLRSASAKERRSDQ
jgi:hypothetical protein